MKNKQYRIRILLTVLCGLVAFCALTLPYAPQSVVIKVSPEKTVSTVHDKGGQFFEWVGLLFLALSVWIWRRELKLTGIGLLSGEPIEQQTPEGFRKEGSGTPSGSDDLRDVAEANSQINREAHDARKQMILDLFKKHHALNVSVVARDLEISAHTARSLLFILMKEGSVRCDGFPRSALYTLTSSPENLALDHIRTMVESEAELDSERRFVRVKRMHEMDGVFEAGDTTYCAEVKYIRQLLSPSRLDQRLLQLLTVAREFRANRLVGILALVVFEDPLMGEAQKTVRQFTYDAGNVDLRIHIFTKSELERAHNKQDAGEGL